METRPMAEKSRGWLDEAVRRIETDFVRSADTHLFRFDIPAVRKILLYLKDESTHPTGSLKHRLARSLFLYSLCNGWIDRNTTIIEASSGSTAISEAYFARLLDLPFVAVVPKTTSGEKLAQIEFYGGRVHAVDPAGDIYAEAHRLARETSGHFMDQFTYAERATDWRGNNNIAEAIFGQMSEERHPVPRWVVCGAGTGGTSATIGRYVRYRRLDTHLCVVDPENSVFFDYYHTGDAALTSNRRSRIEGIGRPRVEPSFVTSVVDRMMQVPDAASFAAMRFLHRTFGRRYGGSTGTNLYGALKIVAEMQASGKEGSVVTLICDSGDRYRDTYYSDGWLSENGIEIAGHLATLERFYETGEWREP
jgi:cysteine synthase A